MTDKLIEALERELPLLYSVLAGYPRGFARDDAMRAIRALQSALVVVTHRSQQESSSTDAKRAEPMTRFCPGCESATLTAPSESEAKDAARWREFRDGGPGSPMYPGAVLMLYADYADGRPGHEVADYDAAIDAALSASKVGGE